MARNHNFLFFALTITTILFPAALSTSQQYFGSTSLILTETNTETNGYWVYGMFACSIVGIILTSVMGIHAIYHLFHHSLSGKCQRLYYWLFFIFSWLVCIGYTLFKTDIIFAMQSIYDCKVGYYFCTSSVYAAKLTLFIVFILRIDGAFHSSSLGYNRCFLSMLTLSFILSQALLYAWYIYASWDIIEYQIDEELIYPVGICTLGTDITTAHQILGLLFIADTIFNLTVCGLFVYKLRKVVLLTKENDHSNSNYSERARSLSRQNSQQQKSKCGSYNKNHKILIVMKKQTILVCISILTGFLVAGLGAVYNPISLLVPIDAIANAFCVWLMFSFSNRIWNKLIKCCCRCCYGMNADGLLQRGTTLSKSMRRISMKMNNKSNEDNLKNMKKMNEMNICVASPSVTQSTPTGIQMESVTVSTADDDKIIAAMPSGLKIESSGSPSVTVDSTAELIV